MPKRKDHYPPQPAPEKHQLPDQPDEPKPTHPESWRDDEAATTVPPVIPPDTGH